MPERPGVSLRVFAAVSALSAMGGVSCFPHFTRAGVPGFDNSAEQPVTAPLQPQATPPAPPPVAEAQPPAAEPQANPARPKKKRIFSKTPRWPGRFVAVRGTLELGDLILPFVSAGATSANGRPVTTSSFYDLAPVLGGELGFAGKHWGASFSVDVAPLGLLSADYFSGAPMHLDIAFNVLYVPNEVVRWDFGFEPYRGYFAGLPAGGNSSFYGVGLRLGGHLRMTGRTAEPEPGTWEAFVLGSFGVLHGTDITYNGTTTSLGAPPAGFASSFQGYFTLSAGAEWTFSY